MKLNMSITELLTAVVAFYGAILSTIIFTKELQKSKRHIKVNMKFGLLTYTNGISPQMLLVEIINPGLKPVTIYGPQLRLPDRRNLIMPISNSNVKFPCELGEGKSAHTWIEVNELKGTLIDSGYTESTKFKAVVTDQTGTEFYSSKWLTFNLK